MIIDYDNDRFQRITKGDATICLIGTHPTLIADISDEMGIRLAEVKRHVRDGARKHWLPSLRVSKDGISATINKSDLCKLRKKFGL